MATLSKRKAPLIAAKEYPVGTKRKGVTGTWWVVAELSGGGKRWLPKPSKSSSSSSSKGSSSKSNGDSEKRRPGRPRKDPNAPKSTYKKRKSKNDDESNENDFIDHHKHSDSFATHPNLQPNIVNGMPPPLMNGITPK